MLHICQNDVKLQKLTICQCEKNAKKCKLEEAQGSWEFKEKLDPF